MQGVTAVHGQISCLGFELDRGHVETFVLSCGLNVGAVRAGYYAERAAATIGSRHGDPNGEAIAVVRVTALAAVLVPGQIREARLDVEGLDETLGAKLCAGVIVTCQFPNPLQTLIAKKRSQGLGPLVKKEHSYRLLDPSGIPRPPGGTIVWRGTRESGVEVRGDRRHLFLAEDVANVQETSLVEEVGDLVAIVVELEAATQIERAAVAIGELDGARLVDRTSIEEGSENGLPANPVSESALGHLDLRVHRQAHGRLPILYEIRERGRIERRDGSIFLRAMVDRQAAVLLAQRERLVLDRQAEGRQALVEKPTPRESGVALDRLREHFIEDFIPGQCPAITVETRSAVDGHCRLLVVEQAYTAPMTLALGRDTGGG